MSIGRLDARRGAPALAVSLALLAGCATAPVQLGKAQLAGERRAACAAAGAPRVWFAKTADARPDPATLGTIGGRTFSSGEVAAWVDDELAAMASPGFTVASGGAANAASLVLRPRILKAYVDGIAVTKTAVVVLGFDIVGPNGEVSSRTYRGQQAGVNWATTEGEGSGALRDAALSCFEQLRADLERVLHPSQPVPAACAAPTAPAEEER
jgi:hypothetical protein